MLRDALTCVAAVKRKAKHADTQRVRVSFTHQLVLASLAVALASVAVPMAAYFVGISAPGWATVTAALGAGGAMGFGFSRVFHSKFAWLRETTEQIRRGDWLADSAAPPARRVLDETDELAASVRAMRGPAGPPSDAPP